MDKINPKNCQVASPLVIQGFSNFLGLFQGIMANREKPRGYWPSLSLNTPLIGPYFWGGGGVAL